MKYLGDDLRFAVRMLLKNPLFTAVAVLTLALGIGANSAIFSVVNGVLLRPLPYQQPDRLMLLSERWKDFQSASVAYLNFLDWRRENRTFDEMACFRSDDFNLTGSGDPERLTGMMISAPFFSVLGINPLMGRGIAATEDRPGGAPVVLISEQLWKRRFNREPAVLGRPLVLNGTAYSVVGVVPESFRFRGMHDVFVPLGQWHNPVLNGREYHPGLRVVARRKAGVSIEQAGADLANIAAALSQQYPAVNTGHSISAIPLKDDIVGDVRPTLWVLIGAVGCVLLIACANVANLLLSRATARRKEIAVRTALGAARSRIIRQLLTESALLSLVGGFVGLLLAAWGMPLVLRVIPNRLPRMEEIAVDGQVLAFTLLASLVTGVLFGLAPAVHLSSSQLRDALRESGRGSVSGRHRLRDLLAVGQVAAALVLLVGGALMLRSIWNLSAVNPGLDPHNVMTLDVSLSPANASSPAAMRAAWVQVIDRIRRIPGVESAATIMDLPLSGDDWEMPLWLPWTPRPQSISDMPFVLWYPAGPDYLRALRIPLIRGRFFTDRDTDQSPAVTVIDEVMAKTMFGDKDPVGQQFFVGPPEQGRKVEVVGIVGHVKHWGLDRDATSKIRSEMYVPFTQITTQFLQMTATGTTIVVRTRWNPFSLVEAVKREVISLDRNQPVYNVRLMDSVVSETMSDRRFSMLLLVVFAGVALTLAAVGIYGVISYSVSQRVHEIGVRMALGAGRREVLKLVVGHGGLIAGAGVAAGLIAATAVTRGMSTLLFGISATDPLSFGIVAAVLAIVALLASYLPARRAAKVDPMVALRHE